MSNFDRYDGLLQALSQADNNYEVELDPAEVYRACVAVGLPLTNDLLTALIQKYSFVWINLVDL